MTLAERLEQLEAAASQPGGLTLRLVDQLTAGQPDLRRALEAAAVPHWWDSTVLAKVLDDDLSPDASAWAERLAALSVVEEFRSHPGAHNVHEVTRLALREKLYRENQLPQLSARALRAFPSPTPEASSAKHIEHLCHLLLADPELGEDSLEKLYIDWHDHGNWASQLDLAAMLEEILPHLAPIARARALLRRAAIRSDRLPLEEIEGQVMKSLELFRQLKNERAEGQALNFLSGLAQAHGNLAQARNFSVQAETIAERLAASDPANAAWQRDLSVSLNKLGNLAVAQGDLAGALRKFTESKTIRERLAASDPANAEWQRDLSVSLEKLGDLAVAQGDLAGALRSFTESKTIAERLAASDPANAEWQRDLSVSLNKLGNLAVAQGDLAGALRSLTKSKTIAERLAASDPANAAWQRDLAVSFEKLGDVAVRQQDFVNGEHYFRERLKIAERLALSDPMNAGWQRDLAVSHFKLYQFAYKKGDEAMAATELQACYTVLHGMKQRGLHFDPPMAGLYEQLHAAFGGES